MVTQPFETPRATRPAPSDGSPRQDPAARDHHNDTLERRRAHHERIIANPKEPSS
ncbi:hypothetical protein NNJEOMEG_02229 [Fundidesulfovibrio magnetotacticus]|uniref:Uncharacterized protein n=1 Tax=Fundidesulfovibrio magnetotacticus TaxID=2730080 RepID=A0A6V8M1Q8_9BACT|nr:hypothetical protein [Fundidesulfovibrio magnetotacticus]GFK94385.1 hypothetical protein NNJEOMEG_02229 [Fundidesulfovibrio magnetotacticus]